MDKLTVKIVNGEKLIVDATFRKLDLANDSLKWFISWFPKMMNLAGEELYGDSRWDVPKIWEAASQAQDYFVYVIECGADIQGYIVVKKGGYVGVDGSPCLYVAFLAAAPWNRKRNGCGQRYVHVGQTLVALAVILGVKHLANRSIELHSLQDAEGFYRKLGFQETGMMKDGMKLLRLDGVPSLRITRPVLYTLMKDSEGA